MDEDKETNHVIVDIKNILPIKMVTKDIQQVIDIYKSYWSYRGLYAYSFLKRVIEQNLSYAYKIGEEIIAFCLVENVPVKRIIEIDLLCVKKEYKGNHLGKSLLNFCINICKRLNFNNFGLHVSTTNTAALGLYSNIGFKIISKIQDYYNDFNPKDNHAYYMTLTL